MACALRRQVWCYSLRVVGIIEYKEPVLMLGKPVDKVGAVFFELSGRKIEPLHDLL